MRLLFRPATRCQSLLASAILALAMPCADAGEPEITLTIHPKVTGGISPDLFGQFVELLGPNDTESGASVAMDPDTGDFRPDVKALLDAMHLPVLRYPGGGFVESPGFRWTQLIDGAPTITGDPADKRTHALGLHEFLDWAEQRKSKVVLVVKAADIARKLVEPAAVLAQARAFVAYVNGRDDASLPGDLQPWIALRKANGRAEPWKIHLWQLGNEFTWVGVKQMRKQGISDPQIGVAYVDAIVQTGEAILGVDPSAGFLAEIDMEQPFVGVAAADSLAARLGDHIEAMTAHLYQTWGIKELTENGESRSLKDFSAEDYWYAAVSTPGTDARGQALFQMPMLQTANRLGYPLALTEWNWNSWWEIPGEKNEAGPKNLWTKGVAAASFLHALLNAPGEISIATQSMLIGDDWDIRAIDAAQTPARFHPSGQVTSLYGAHHGSERLLWTASPPIPTYAQNWKLGELRPSKAVAEIDCVVTRSPDSLFIHLINRRFDTPASVAFDTAAVVPGASTQATIHRLEREPAPAASSASRDYGRLVTSALERAPDALWRTTLPPATVSVVEIPIVPSKSDAVGAANIRP